MLFEGLMPKMKRIYFPNFIYFIFPFHVEFYLEFVCGDLQYYWEVSCEKSRKFINLISIYEDFSDIYAIKLVGRIDPSRLERVKYFWS